MKTDLVRFGVAMERSLLEQLDGLVRDRKVTRSEVLRDLVRGEVVRSQVIGSTPAVATLTLVYDHHVRELTERLTEFQHRLGDRVRSTLHVHLDEQRCLEVVVLRGRSDELKRAADQLLATRGVTHGGIEIVAEDGVQPVAPPRARKARADTHGHAHDDGSSSYEHSARKSPRRAASRAPSRPDD